MRLFPPKCDQLGKLLRVLASKVVGLAVIDVLVIELPLVIGPVGPRPVPGDRSPALVPDGAAAQHLVVLRRLDIRCVAVADRGGEAMPFERLLIDTVDARRDRQPGHVEQRRVEVGDVVVLRANRALVGGGDLCRPVHDHWVGVAAAVRVALPSLERCVARLAPANRVVRVGMAAAHM